MSLNSSKMRVLFIFHLWLLTIRLHDDTFVNSKPIEDTHVRLHYLLSSARMVYLK